MSRQRMMRSAVLTILIGSTGGLSAQEAPRYKVDVPVVNILATVRDKTGKIVTDLSKEDFILYENDRRQEIQYFSRQSDLPLTVGLLVDTSQSQRRLIDDERQASYQFFEQVLRPAKDRAFVIRFDVEAELMQDLTGSRRLLERALNALKSLAQETGGKMFEVSKKMPLREIFARIEEELRSQYSLGYTSSDDFGDGFRSIRLSTANDSLQVTTRSGYYPQRP